MLQLAAHAARVRELEVELERLHRLRPDVPPPVPGCGRRGCASRSARGPPGRDTPIRSSPEHGAPVRLRGPGSTRPPEPPLEERLGTRWAVWVGGLALALGGLLLVRYSIEQGMFGPGVRVALGALFALALIAAGEWFRRTEPRLPVEAIPAAHVPSILTAAGTASAFGTVYAAHALYGFIGPAAAFVLLGIIGIATMLAAALHGPALAGLGLAGSLIVPMLVSSRRRTPGRS